MTDKTYTIAELEALPDADLCALAAEMRGWSLRLVGVVYHWYENDIFRHDWLRWTPHTNRNQSGELLEWAVTQGAEFEVYFEEEIEGFNGDDDGESYQSEVTAGARIRVWSPLNNGEYSFCVIPGTSAHSETIAFCAAMLAQQGRLKQ